MEKDNNYDILKQVSLWVNEEHLPEKERHLEFPVYYATFVELKSALERDIKKFKDSPLWSKTLPEITFHDRIVSIDVAPLLSPWDYVNVDLSLQEIESINQVIRSQIDEYFGKKEVPLALIDAFTNLNTDYQMAGGEISPTYKAYIT